MSEWQRSKFQAPAVRQRRNFGHRNRIAAPYEQVQQNSVGAGVLDGPHDRCKDFFPAPHQRQRRRSRDDPFYKTKKEISRDRAVEAGMAVPRIARREVKEPEVPSGAFAYFCHCRERSERRRWRIQRGERVAAVKISSVRRKAAWKFWAPQQFKSRSLRRAKHPTRR